MRYFLSFYLVLFSMVSEAQLISDKILHARVDSMFEVQKKLTQKRSAQLFKVFDQQLTKEETLALKFLYAFMPLSDLADYNGDFFLANVRQSLKAKNEFSWGKKIPSEVFLHFVLPVRVNNENIDSFRTMVYEELKARIKGLSMKEAALAVNHWCHEKVTYKGSDERTSSPLASIKTSFGRCGEESTFTVAAMRTVGIPARQVYTPRWAHTDDNHAWVEVWIDGKWYFLGACEPEPDLNMGWFAEPAKRAMLVHTRAFGWYNGSEPTIMREDRFSELNLIANYAPVKKLNIKVVDSLNRPVENAKVEYQLYNYAEFFPLAKSFTDKKGITGITCGLGDLLLWANKDDAWGFYKMSSEKNDTIILKISHLHLDLKAEEFDLIPPVQRTPAIVSEEGKKENNRLLQKEDSIRTIYMKTFKDSAWAVSFAGKLKLNADSIRNMIVKSYGNWNEITEFLEETEPAKRKWALALLGEISEKDLRDTKKSILKNHLNNAFSNLDSHIPTSGELFKKYILNPRISYEKLSPWRSFLQSEFSGSFAKDLRKDIGALTRWIELNIKTDKKANLHSRAPLSPEGVYKIGIADPKSKDLFFVATCRSMGIPARLNPELLVPQYWSGTEWKTVLFEKETTKEISNGFFHLINESATLKPKYYINFTIAVFKDGVYRTLQFEENRLIDDFPDKIEVETGKYMVVTGNRMKDGSVLSRVDFFEVKEGATTNVQVKIRDQQEKPQVFGTVDPSQFTFMSHGGSGEYKMDESVKTKGAILIYIDPDKEPTKHVMADIPALKKTFDDWGGPMFFILDKNNVSASFNPKNYKNLPANSKFAYDSQNKFLAEIEKIKKRPLKNLPLIIFVDENGGLIFLTEGYQIGVGEQLAKELRRYGK